MCTAPSEYPAPFIQITGATMSHEPRPDAADPAIGPRPIELHPPASPSVRQAGDAPGQRG
jgi:hypothetical protein